MLGALGAGALNPGVADKPHKSKRLPESGLPRKSDDLPSRNKHSGLVQRKLSVGAKRKRKGTEPFDPQKAEDPGPPKVRTRVAPGPTRKTGPDLVPRSEQSADAKTATDAQEESLEEPLEESPDSVPQSPRPSALERSSEGGAAEAQASSSAASPSAKSSHRVATKPSPAISRPTAAEAVAVASATSVRSEAASRPRSDARHQEQEEEEAWAGTDNASLWWVLAGLVCIGVIAIFMAQFFNADSQGEQITGPKRTEVVVDGKPTPISDFVERSAELLPVLQGMLDQVVAADQAGDDAKLAELLRGGEEGVALRKKWRARQPPIARHHPVHDRQLHAAAIGDSGYLVLAGRNAEHLSAIAYFVQEDGEYKFDWAASEGYSELLPTEADGLNDNEPRLIRGVINGSILYTPQFPEEKYRCYTIHHQDPNKYLWAFAERKSELDYKLLMSFRAPDLGGTKGRVTLKVRKGPEGARPNQVEIVEFLQTDWVLPTKQPEP